MRILQRFFGSVLAASLALQLAACEGAMEVRNPNIVVADEVDPEQDAATFARSAFQNLATAYGGIVVYTAWFTNEARVGDTFPTRNEYGRRLIDNRNGTHNSEVWAPLALAMESSEGVLDILEGKSDVNVARAALTAGYSALLMAEAFCEGAIRVDRSAEYAQPQSKDQMLDHAINRFELAISAGDAAGGAEGTSLANAARVGLARAYLFKGDNANAVSAANQVPDDFNFNLNYVDDASARGRLSNNVHIFSNARESLVVGPEWRQIADDGDERIKYIDGERMAQDGVHNFYIQQKYPNYAAPIRLASGLEARYIAAEASGDITEQLALINERRAEFGQAPYAGPNDANSVLTELLFQKGLDFWLEAKRMGDWRRNPDNVKFIIKPSDEYYKPDVGPMGSDTCFPLPAAETDHNPNFS